MPATFYKSPSVFGSPSLFLAGGITGCPDWQSMAEKLLDDMGSELAIINPRAEFFDVTDDARTEYQIRWEYRMLRRADAILFWFGSTSVAEEATRLIQPIALFELGAHLMVAGKPIFIGTHPDYPRRVDVRIQVGEIRPEIEIVHDLESLAQQVFAWERADKVSWQRWTI